MKNSDQMKHPLLINNWAPTLAIKHCVFSVIAGLNVDAFHTVLH